MSSIEYHNVLVTMGIRHVYYWLMQVTKIAR